MAVQKEYVAAAADISPSDLPALVDGEMSVASAEQTGGAAEFLDFEFQDAGLTQNEGDVVADLYIVRSLDGGTTYPDIETGTSSGGGQPEHYVGSFIAGKTTSAAAVVLQILDVPAPPGEWKAHVLNKSGETFDATTCTLDVRGWRHKDA